MPTWRAQRKFPRHASEFRVLYRTAWEFDAIASGQSFLLAEAAGDYIEGVARNISYRKIWIGGMFIATQAPFPAGAIVELSFLFDSDNPRTGLIQLPETLTTVHNFHGSWNKRAIVRWHRYRDEPKGMGVEFVNFPFANRPDVDRWVERIREGH